MTLPNLLQGHCLSGKNHFIASKNLDMNPFTDLRVVNKSEFISEYFLIF